VVLNSTLDTTLLLNKHSTTGLNSHMNRLPGLPVFLRCRKRKEHPMINNANDGFVMKTAQVKLGIAPVPMDIIWENYSYTWSYRLLIRIPVFFLRVTPLIFTILATTYLLFLQNDTKGSVSTEQGADLIGTQM
jgi:hypothetical protein